MNFTFLNPQFLWLALPAVVLVIYAYLKQGNARQQIVSSTFLLKKLKKKSSGRKKLNLPFRFFWELLTLLLLILAIAGIYFHQAEQNILVLIDNSLSTSLKLSSGKSVLAENTKTAEERIDAESGSRFKVCFTSPAFTCSDKYLTATEAKNKITDTQNFAVQDNLAEKLKLLGNEKLDKAWIFSDYLPGEISGKISFFSSKKEGHGNVAIKRIADNKIHLESFNKFAINGTLVLESFKKEKNQLSKINTEMQTVSIAPGSSEINISLPDEITAVYLEKDNIFSDSVYWYIPEMNEQKQILLVSNDTLKANLPFDSEIKTISVQEYSSLGNFSDYSFIIFKNYFPENLPAVNNLILAANQGKLMDAVEVTDWQGSHEILKYLSANQLSFSKVWLNKLPSWYQKLITLKDQPALAVSEKDAVRSVYVSFPLLPFQGSENKPLSILTLNIFKWLESSVKNNQNKNFEKFYYLDEEAELKESQTSDISSGIFLNQNKTSVRNFYFPEESNTLVIQSISAELKSQTHTTTDNDKNNFTSYLIYLVLGLSLLGLLIWR